MAVQGGLMSVLTYNDESLDIDFVTVNDIYEAFSIPKRKNLYKLSDNAGLVGLYNDNLKKQLKDGDQIEAITDFTLG